MPPDSGSWPPIERTPLQIPCEGTPLPALLDRPETAWCALALAHGAGAGMHHPHLERLARHLAQRGVTILRYEFEYMAKGSRRPDRPPRLHRAVAAAVEAATEIAPGLPLFGGGRSMGGRMTSEAAGEGMLPGLRGIVFFAFPLHPARARPARLGTERADHLSSVRCPLLFLQGTRDRLADLELLKPVVAGLGHNATLYVVEGADHSFGMLKRSGRTQEQVEIELAEVATDWMKRQLLASSDPTSR